MNWLEVVSNPKAIAHLYDAVPPLNNMEVTKLILKSAGPTLTFNMDMPRFADYRPSRWEPECNVVSVEIDFFAVENLQLTGFPPMPILDFEIRKEGRLIAVSASGKNCKIEFTCLDVSIQKVSGYAKGAF
jgi:hypothetical protein